MASKILYCGGNTMDNLGNGFLDIGAWYQLREVFPDAEIISISNTFPSKRYLFGNPTGMLLPGRNKPGAFDLRLCFDADYIVFTAACLADYWVTFNAELIDWIIKTQIKVVILGASGSDSGSFDYDNSEQKRIRDIVRKMNFHLMTSRDQATFDNYADLADHAHNGIDCAMFLNDAFQPSKMTIGEFDVFTFDAMKEPQIKTDRQVLRLCHKVSWVDSFCRMIRHPKKVLQLAYKMDWASEFPEDYLQLYGNCDTVHTDRVHACVAALIFGNKARYYGKSPRYGLLPRVLQGADITKEPVMLDLDFVASEKQKQLDFLHTVFN